MRISELSQRSDIPVATVKYYLREGLLHPGHAVNARQSSYDDTHVTRLRLIRGLVHVLGNSIEQVRDIVEIVDGPERSALSAMAKATTAVATLDGSATDTPTSSSPARKALDDLGFRYEQTSQYVQELDAALKLAEQVGISLVPEHLQTYADAARKIAQADFDRIPWGHPKEAVQFAVLGTALYEPVLLALRRIAHYEQGLMRADDTTTND